MARGKKKKMLFNNERSTRENTAKEQPYLMPGTEPYEEYQSDLQMHDPFKPDDKWHDDLEADNAAHAAELQAQEQVRHGLDKVQGKRNYQKQISKTTQFKKVKAAAISNAALTETLDDDKRASGMRLKDVESLVYDNGVTQDDFEKEALDELEFQ